VICEDIKLVIGSLTSLSGSTLDRLSEGEGVITTAKPKEFGGGILGQRERLPIAKQRTKLLYMVQKYPVVIVVGQTGCGKTTRE
jgi:ATP-dependent RNA helicase DDX35